MKIDRIFRNKIIAWIVLLIIFIFCAIPTLPKYTHITFDSGIFLYGGQQILKGDLPYKDFFEVRTPIIYYLNALGLSFGIGRLGVWLIESALLISAIFIFFNALYKKSNFWIALTPAIILTFFLKAPKLISYGNLSEIYSVAFIIMLISFVINNLDKDKSWDWIFAGMLSFLVFLTKQSTAGIVVIVFFALIYCIVINKDKKLKKIFIFKTTYFLIGLLSSIVVLIVILVSIGNFKDLIEANFKYALFYSTNIKLPIITIIKTMSISVFREYSLGNLLVVAIVFSIINLINKKNTINSMLRLISLMVVFGLPIELFLVAIPGKFYNHYFYSLIPYLTLGLFIFCYQIKYFFKKNIRKSQKFLFLVLIFFLTNTSIICYDILKEYKTLISFKVDSFFQSNNDNYIIDEQKTPSYLNNIYSGKDFMIWGGELKFYFLTDRKFPIKYIDFFPLFNEKYFNNKIFNNFFEDFKNNAPDYIIDASYDYNAIPPLDRVARNTSPLNTNQEVLEPFYNYFEENYHKINSKIPMHDNWKVYALKQ